MRGIYVATGWNRTPSNLSNPCLLEHIFSINDSLDTKHEFKLNTHQHSHRAMTQTHSSAQPWTPVWTGLGPDVAATRRRATCNAQHSVLSRSRPQVWAYAISILSYSAVESRRTLKEVMGRRRMKGRRIAITALCGAAAATSRQGSVWRRSGRKECWDGDANGFCETGFVQNFRMTGATLQPQCLFLFVVSQLWRIDRSKVMQKSLWVWGHMSKNQIWIWFRTKYENSPHLIWEGQIPCNSWPGPPTLTTTFTSVYRFWSRLSWI